jgi:hypothetical protein
MRESPGWQRQALVVRWRIVVARHVIHFQLCSVGDI